MPRESSASASNGGKERDERSHSLSRPLIVTIVKMAASGAKAGFSTPTRRACLGDPPQKVEPIAIMVHDPTGNFAVLAMI